jgi:hypothetical protein
VNPKTHPATHSLPHHSLHPGNKTHLSQMCFPIAINTIITLSPLICITV